MTGANAFKINDGARKYNYTSPIGPTKKYFEIDKYNRLNNRY